MKEPSAYTDKQKVLAPSNPFLASDDNSSAEHSVRDIALQLLAEQSARKRNSKGVVLVVQSIEYVGYSV